MSLADVYTAYAHYKTMKNQVRNEVEAEIRAQVAERMVEHDLDLSRALRTAHAAGSNRTTLRDAIGKKGDYPEFKRLFDAAEDEFQPQEAEPEVPVVWTVEQVDEDETGLFALHIWNNVDEPTIQVDIMVDGTIHPASLRDLPQSAIVFVESYLTERSSNA